MPQEIAWFPVGSLTQDSDEITLSRGYTGLTAHVFRATLAIDGMSFSRHAPTAEAALCAILDGLDEMRLAALAEEEGDDDDQETGEP